MSVITVSLQELKENKDQYFNKKVRISDFPLFTTVNMAYSDYHIQIGPRGGMAVHYGRSRRMIINSSDVYKATPETGVTHSATAYQSYIIFPAPYKIPAKLKAIEKDLVDIEKKYKRTYESARKRLKQLRKLNDEYPEYSL